MTAATPHLRCFSAAGHLKGLSDGLCLPTGLYLCELFYPHKDSTLTSNALPNDMGEKEGQQAADA